MLLSLTNHEVYGFSLHDPLADFFIYMMGNSVALVEFLVYMSVALVREF